MTETRTPTERAALESGICAREGCSSKTMSKARAQWRQSYCRRCVSQGYHQHRMGRTASIQSWFKETPLDTSPSPLTVVQRAALIWISKPEVREGAKVPTTVICRGLRRRGLLREGEPHSQGADDVGRRRMSSNAGRSVIASSNDLLEDLEETLGFQVHSRLKSRSLAA